ncbi:folylpolyglutamate synthase/dihydrofolate synthase family protein [Opitutus sp. ER46]|uniref:bifunctional folylpolyglutamate synthase/dihydrofolate synthase n=1 Tax=Opitutus sp. ER46 TaxID=2161864 RepID=UPI001E32B84A|nr:folylpolyglutamate synthase/dihydrofolate synthase family protein [Opitutus sp. ER46]
MVDRLFALKAHGPHFGVDRMRVLAEALGHPERSVPCVHIAGTNGKGSVAAMLEAMLRAAGWRTGLYTSPHLVHLGERVQVDRRALTEEQILTYAAELDPVAARIAAADPTLRPSFFELMTAMAFLEFQRRRCDIAVIEVGLGGRLDATNVVTPELAVITSIGLDHCELLGNSLAQIAAEKAGIIKPAVPVVIGRMPRDAEKVIRALAAQLGAPIQSVAERFRLGLEGVPSTRLEGEYQRWNAATATLAAQQLDPRWRMEPAAIRQGLERVEWAGRWERRRVGGRTVILDASHNSEGALALEANLSQLVAETHRRPVIVTGVLGLDRARPLLDVISRYARAVHLVVPHEPRACGYEELEKAMPRGFPGRVVRDTVEQVFPAADRCAVGETDDIVVVTGSIYLLGEVMARLETGL